MARNCSLFAFLTICTLLCVSAFEEDPKYVDKDVKVVEVAKILRLPSEGDSIPWEQSPIEIHSFGVPKRGEDKEANMEHHPTFPQGGRRPMRFRFGRPGGCHGKFRHFLMPTEDQLSRRMGMRGYGHVHAHAHPFSFSRTEDLRGDGMGASRAFPFDRNSERDGREFEKHREEEREGRWTAWVKGIFN